MSTTEKLDALFYDKGGAVHNVQHSDYGAAGDGTTDDRAAFAAADTSANNAATLVVPPGTYAIASNLTISSAIWLSQGATLKPASGVTVTLSGPLTAGRYQIFDTSASGTISLSGEARDEIFPEWWGIDGTDDGDEIALAFAEGNTRLLVGRTYVDPGDTSRLITGLGSLGKQHLIAHGATLQDMILRDGSGGDSWIIEGGLWHATNAMSVGDASPIVVSGTNVRLSQIVVETDPAVVDPDLGWGDGIELKETADTTSILNCIIDIIDADCVVIQGSNTLVQGCRIKSQDDGVVLKAINAAIVGTRISDIHAEDCADIVAMGTQAAFDCRDTVVSNLVGEGVARGLYLKPGNANENGGHILGWTTTGMSLSDPAGDRFNFAVHLKPTNSCQIHGLLVDNVAVRTRGVSGAVAGIRATPDGDAGGSDVRIERATISNFDIRDLHDGVAESATDDDGATAVGDPVDFFVYLEESNSAEIRDLTIKNLRGWGSSNHGVFINCPSDNVITFDGLDLRQWGRASGNGFRISAGTARLQGPTRIDSTASGDPFSVASGGVLLAEREEFFLGDLAAGTNRTWNLRSFDGNPGGRGYVYRVLLMDEGGIAKDGTDFLNLDLQDSDGNNIVSQTTGTAGVALTAGEFTALNTDHPTGAKLTAAHISAAGERVQFKVQHQGAGQALTRARLIIEYAYY